MNYNVNKYGYKGFLGLVIVLNYSSNPRAPMSLLFLPADGCGTGSIVACFHCAQ